MSVLFVGVAECLLQAFGMPTFEVETGYGGELKAVASGNAVSVSRVAQEPFWFRDVVREPARIIFVSVCFSRSWPNKTQFTSLSVSVAMPHI